MSDEQKQEAGKAPACEPSHHIVDVTEKVKPRGAVIDDACECPTRSNETAVVERRYNLRDRYHAVILAIHAIDYIRNSDLPFVDKANACETLADGVMNALDGRATGREFRTARHSRLAKQDPQHHPVVSEEDRRCHDCGAVKPEPFSHCWQHRASAPCPLRAKLAELRAEHESAGKRWAKAFVENDSLRAKVEAARSIADQARLGNRDLRGALEAIDAALREESR